MASGTITLILTGARAGQTCELMKYGFVKGRLTLQGDMTALAGVVKYFGRTYKAFPEGSAELAFYQAQDAQREAHGERNLQAAPGRGDSEASRAGVQPSGKGTPQVPADPGSGTAHAEAGAAGILPGGSGQAPGMSILEALQKLDPKNDDHWTNGGQPFVSVVEKLVGHPVTRADILAEAPTFLRPTGRD